MNDGNALDDVTARVALIDAARVAADLDARGAAVVPALWTPDACAALARRYDDASQFRKRVVMARYGFGRGEYQYFAEPLPALVTAWRNALYPLLAAVANRWSAALGHDVTFPAAHADFLARCHDAGQRLPTPLLLSYGPGDYNCLHQDLYGKHVFPLQVATLLSAPMRDFTGGELVLTEQRPRMQSRVEVIPLEQGDAVVFAVNERPVQGTRGVYRAKIRHGVSPVRTGQRRVLGLIFHDAAS